MNRSRQNFLTILIVVIIILGQFALIYIMINNASAGEQIIGYLTGGFLPILLLVFDYFKGRSVKLFLFTQRIRANLIPTLPSWFLTASFTGPDINLEVLDKITRELQRTFGAQSQVKVRRISDKLRQFEIPAGPSINIELSDISSLNPVGSSEKKKATLHITIRNYQVDYRNTSYALKQKITPLLELIVRVVGKVDTRFSLNVEYESGSNPFLSIVIAKLNPKYIQSFTVAVSIPEYGAMNDIYISEKGLSINTTSQNALQNLAIDFLTFQPNVSERLQNAST